MKFFKWALPTLLLFSLLGCECEQYECPAFSHIDDRNWLPNGTRLVYESEHSNKKRVVNIATKNLSERYGEEETTLSLYCNNNDCYASAAVYGSIDDTVSAQNQMEISINMVNTFDKKTLVESKLIYSIGLMNNSFRVQPTLLPNGNATSIDWLTDSIKDVNTGNRIYPNTLIQTLVPNNNNKIAKTYWCQGFGLIGFHRPNRRTVLDSTVIFNNLIWKT